VLPLLHVSPEKRPTALHCVSVLDRVLIKVLNALKLLLSEGDFQQVLNLENDKKSSRYVIRINRDILYLISCILYHMWYMICEV
jgi:hypothetical protein